MLANETQATQQRKHVVSVVHNTKLLAFNVCTYALCQVSLGNPKVLVPIRNHRHT
ncbi:hypothetical protein DES52_108207 [Deinococcus yavapaiensis KR-236]|uniref:Uncharacterized protein n=1 Tax=Deinococcus yavapaiensis KR-236 TaxID=694435 RepID=A0A318SI54_9DEIO|nr:hypothetical protein DES52_108207 [Deinococcus yavapaiensis KR-236]